MITRTHKIRLIPTFDQEVFFKKACGVARIAYNWGLGRWAELYNSGNKPNALQLKKEFNSVKKNLFPWMSETHKDANQQPFTNLNTAFTNFFKKRARYPRFKKKGVRDSFYISNDKFSLSGKKLRMPKLGWVKLREELRFSGKINSAVVTRVADQWYVSISVTLKDTPRACDNQEAVGVDLGIKVLATLSNGVTFGPPRPLRYYDKKLSLLQRRLSRKKKGSNNRRKAILKVSRIYNKITCVRNDALHKLTTYLANNFNTTIIEDLNVSGMMKNRRLSKAISGIGFYEFRRQLGYKTNVVVIDRWFPSSKKCSSCGTVKKTLLLSERIYRCGACGLKIDRDFNASLNIKQIGTASSESTSVDKRALAINSVNSETILGETEIQNVGTFAHI